LCLVAFPLDFLFFLPYGSGMRRIYPCNPFLIQLEKKKKKKKKEGTYLIYYFARCLTSLIINSVFN